MSSSSSGSIRLGSSETTARRASASLTPCSTTRSSTSASICQTAMRSVIWPMERVTEMAVSSVSSPWRTMVTTVFRASLSRSVNATSSSPKLGKPMARQILRADSRDTPAPAATSRRRSVRSPPRSCVSRSRVWFREAGGNRGSVGSVVSSKLARLLFCHANFTSVVPRLGSLLNGRHGRPENLGPGLLRLTIKACQGRNFVQGPHRPPVHVQLQVARTHHFLPPILRGAHFLDLFQAELPSEFPKQPAPHQQPLVGQEILRPGPAPHPPQGVEQQEQRLRRQQHHHEGFPPGGESRGPLCELCRLQPCQPR